jgi:ubiquitin C-terminal hydrolase
MSDLVKYNKEYLPKGQGLINLGATCYFNSLLQCLLSCTSIFEVLTNIKDEEHVKNNSLAKHLLMLWESALRGENIYNICIPVWRDIISISQRQNNRVKMDSGQQDAHEGLMMFLDAMETIPEIRRLFMHRHLIQIFCDKCNDFVVEKKETNYVFEAQPDLKTEQVEKFKSVDEYYNTSMPLNEFLRKQNGYIDADFKCPKCQNLGEKLKITTLIMAPEILPVVFKKYRQKVVTPFPAKLEFFAKGGNKKYIYKLVAQSEHSGSMAGGHYWAICDRKDGWKVLNDSRVENHSAGPTENTYIIFYNYVGEVDTNEA